MSNLIKHFSITIDNVPLKKEESEGLLSFSLSQSIHAHHTMILAFRQDVFDTDKDVFSKSKGYLGKRIDLGIEVEESKKKLSFVGIVTSIKTNRSSLGGDVLDITALSPDIVLDDGSMCRSFSEKTLKDITTKVVSPYKLMCPFGGTIQNETGTKPYIVQYKETSFQFLNRLAAKYGQWFFYDGEILTFGKLDQPSTIELIYGKDLFDFRIGLKLEPFSFGLTAYDAQDEGDQVYESKASKQSVSGELSPLAKTAFDASEKLFASDTMILYNHRLNKDQQQKHLDSRVRTKKSGKASGLLIINCESDNPELKVGSRVKIVENIEGSKIPQGQFTIINIEHTADRIGQYSNTFSGIPSECTVPLTSNPHSFPFCETQSATVQDNIDPDNLGRIRVKFFWQNDEITPWIRIINPYAGNDKGHHFIPEIEEEVLVAFEAGNAEKAYILGGMYHGKAKPESWKTDHNDIKAIRTRTGHTLEFDDTDGKEEVRIYDYNKENYFITLKTHSKEIIIEAVENIEIKAKNISIIAEKDFKLEATDIAEKASGNKKTNISGNLDISAKGNIAVKSSGNIEQKASANMTVKGSANTTVEGGATTTIKAGAKLEESAPIVKIN